MKVCILTEGGRNIGFGHITRCISIYQGFQEIGVLPQLIVNGDKGVQYLLKGRNCRLFDWVNDRQTLFEIVSNADIVFIDSYLADYDLYEKISDVAETCVYFDDDLRIDYPKGFVLNGAVFAEQMPYPERKDVTYLLGTEYAPLRKEFWDVPLKPLSKNIETIMITFGGTHVHNLTPKVLGLLTSSFSELRKKVIIAKGLENVTEIEKLKDNNTGLIYHPDAAEMKEVMLESDVAIAAGGQTLYELTRVGVPTIVVAVADNQLNNIRGWEKVGFIEYAGGWEDKDLTEIIKHKIELLKSKSVREHKRMVGSKLIDGGGSFRIVKELLSNFYQRRLTLRKATSSDAQALFDLANEDIVRKNSFSSEEIEWDHHLQWLKAKLEDNNCLLLVFDCSSKFAAQVRFDVSLEQKEAAISISLEKNMRGLRLSPFIISESIKELLKTHEDVELVKAYVKEGNIASIKSFERAGFKFLENTKVDKCKSRIYGRVTEDERYQYL